MQFHSRSMNNIFWNKSSCTSSQRYETSFFARFIATRINWKCARNILAHIDIVWTKSCTAPIKIRTSDRLLIKPMLYQLSYRDHLIREALGLRISPFTWFISSLSVKVYHRLLKFWWIHSLRFAQTGSRGVSSCMSPHPAPIRNVTAVGNVCSTYQYSNLGTTADCADAPRSYFRRTLLGSGTSRCIYHWTPLSP